MTTRKQVALAEAWQILNTRQQTYMQAIYDTDQVQEQAERLRAAMDRWSRPADEWRWMLYADTMYGYTPLKQRLVDAGVVDPGTGSTFEALEKRGYILVKYEWATPHPRADTLVYVRLTTAGRKLVRQALGLSAPKKAPVGELREWHWRALCRASMRGEQGMGSDADTGDGFGYVSWNTCLRLRDYRIRGQERPLIREGRYGESFALVITDVGKQFYRENWQHYRDLYPAVAAPEPDERERTAGGQRHRSRYMRETTH